jgi:hypothetical protein
MRRRLATLLVLLSAVLFVALAAAWVRSYFVEDFIRIYRGDRRVQIFSLGGQIAFITMPARTAAVRGVRWDRRTVTSGTPYSDDRLTALWRFRHVPTRDGGYTIFPHWPVVAVAGLPAGAWFALRERARRRRRAAGLDSGEEPPASA